MEKKIRIGKIEYDALMLAPMAGFSDGVFRTVCFTRGAGYSTTEMISAKAVTYGDVKTKAIAAISPDEGPVACQIFGHEPEIAAQAVRLLKEEYEKAGVKPCAFDINMGCPVPKVVRNGEGSALMRDPALAGEMISATAEAAGDIPVTVKFRLGWDKSSINVVELSKIAEERGASAICVHARTRSQMYEPFADWSYIKLVKEAVSIPVIGNGDVTSGDDALRMFDETGCDAVAIARGALGNPWIFDEIRAKLDGKEWQAPSKRERVMMAISHLELSVARKGEYKAVRDMRSHTGYYTKGLYGSPRVRNELNLAETFAEVKALLLSLLD